MCVFKTASVSVFIIFFCNHYVFAKVSSDCNKEKIRKNYFRVDAVYKRSAETFHDNRFLPKYFGTSIDSDLVDAVLYNFPQRNYETESYKLPILSENNQRSTSPYIAQPQSPIMQALGRSSPQIYQNLPEYPSNLGIPLNNQLKSNNFNNFGFLQNSPQYLPQNVPNGWIQHQQLGPFITEQPFNQKTNFQNVLSMLGNIDAFPMEPLKRLRRDCINSESRKFVEQECCSETGAGCPFPIAYINLNNRIRHCKLVSNQN